MEIPRVLDLLVKNLSEQAIRYAVIGGFALNALGILRSTMDIDLLVHRDDLPALDDILTANLYSLRYRSENVSQYVGAVKPLGNLDVLHAFRAHTLAMLQRARQVCAGERAIALQVVRPEDLIGLKLQALTNNPGRKTLEYADIELLLAHWGHTLDWAMIEEYFTIFQLQDQFAALRSRYGHPE